jgi:hypothetical protein
MPLQCISTGLLTSLLTGFLTGPALPGRPLQEPSAKGAECREWRECRQLALDAFDQGDFERFHDLAWKTVQTGPRRDIDLMYLLARAQSLSGRPHDALVMLGRLADMGVATDAAVNDEFLVVRTLRDWPGVEQRMLAIAAGSKPAPRPAPTPPAPPSATTPPPPPSDPSEPRAAVIPPRTSDTSRFGAEDVLRLPSTTLNPTGLAYDRVSGRFVLADRRERKLVILDERSRHLVDLVGAESAGFYEITALEIDLHRGDLWVVSANEQKAESGPATTLHKLQLVSGRPRATLALADEFGPARFEDVAVSARGTVFTLDGVGKRIFRLAPDEHGFVLAAALSLEGPTSLAPVDDRIIYVAHATGVTMIDVSTGTTARLRGPKGAQLAGLERIRWNRDSLIGIQRLQDGARRIVRIRLNGPSGRVRAVDVVARDVSMTDPMAATLSEDVFYFVIRERDNNGPDSEIIVRRARLR